MSRSATLGCWTVRNFIGALPAAGGLSTPAPGTCITGSGYDHDRMVGKRDPTRRDLDKVSPDHPVWLGRCCAHMGVANSGALKLAGISRDTPDPPGGVIVRENGEPTGLLQ